MYCYAKAGFKQTLDPPARATALGRASEMNEPLHWQIRIATTVPPPPQPWYTLLRCQRFAPDLAPAALRAGFTSMCSSVPGSSIVRMLHDMIATFDDLLDPLGILKVDTVGARSPFSALSGRIPLRAAAKRLLCRPQTSNGLLTKRTRRGFSI